MVTEYVHLAYLDVIGDTATFKAEGVSPCIHVSFWNWESSQTSMLHISISCYYLRITNLGPLS